MEPLFLVGFLLVGARAGVLGSCVLVRRAGMEICKLSDPKQDCSLVLSWEQSHRLTLQMVLLHLIFSPDI